MAGLHLDPELHAVGERSDIPEDVARTAAWWVASELVRRHPTRLTVIETHPAGGQYDCLAVYRTDCEPAEAMVVLLNTAGHLTHGSWFRRERDDDSCNEDDRFNWFEVLTAPRPRQYVVVQIERVEGLPTPRSAPRTTRRSVGARVLGRLASMLWARREGWELRNAYHDAGDASRETRAWADAVPGITFEPMVGDFAGQPAYRYWGVLKPDGRPAAAVDVRRGLAWRPDGDGAPIDLLAVYSACQRRLDQVVGAVLPEILER